MRAFKFFLLVGRDVKTLWRGEVHGDNCFVQMILNMLEFESVYKRGSSRQSSVLSHHAVCKEETKDVSIWL